MHSGANGLSLALEVAEEASCALASASGDAEASRFAIVAIIASLAIGRIVLVGGVVVGADWAGEGIGGAFWAVVAGWARAPSRRISGFHGVVDFSWGLVNGALRAVVTC